MTLFSFALLLALFLPFNDNANFEEVVVEFMYSKWDEGSLLKKEGFQYGVTKKGRDKLGADNTTLQNYYLIFSDPSYDTIGYFKENDRRNNEFRLGRPTIILSKDKRYQFTMIYMGKTQQFLTYEGESESLVSPIQKTLKEPVSTILADLIVRNGMPIDELELFAINPTKYSKFISELDIPANDENEGKRKEQLYVLKEKLFWPEKEEIIKLLRKESINLTPKLRAKAEYTRSSPPPPPPLSGTNPPDMSNPSEDQSKTPPNRPGGKLQTDPSNKKQDETAQTEQRLHSPAPQDQNTSPSNAFTSPPLNEENLEKEARKMLIRSAIINNSPTTRLKNFKIRKTQKGDYLHLKSNGRTL
jgi:hypothetical protein